MVEAPNPHEVHPTSISFVYKVFQNLDMLGMGTIQLPEWPLSKQLFTTITYPEHLKILIPTWESPQMAPNHGIPCQSTMGLSHAGHCWYGQSNTTYPSPIRYVSHPAQLPNSLPTNSSKIEKTAPSMQTTSQFILIKHCHFGSDCGASAIHQRRQKIPHHQALASTSILAEIARELAKIHPIKPEPSLTPPKTHINQTSPF
jgi:hypothetical protein